LAKDFYIIIVFYLRSSVVYISTKEDDTNKIAKFPIITFVQILLHSSSMTFAKKELAEYGQKLTTYNLFFLKVQITRNSPTIVRIKENMMVKYQLYVDFKIIYLSRYKMSITCISIKSHKGIEISFYFFKYILSLFCNIFH
jgi:hypothetical protein